MTNYFNMKNDKVVKFHEDRKIGDRRFYQHVIATILILAISSFLVGWSVLPAMVVGIFCIYLTESEVSDLQNRIAILDDEIEELRLKNFIYENKK